MGADEDVEGAENDFAIDRDAVRVPRDKITREEARDRKKRENPFKHPERPNSAEAKPRKAFPLLSAKVQPIWPIQSEWASLAEGDALALELGALEEAGLYAAYLERVEASLNVYGQKLDERPGDPTSGSGAARGNRPATSGQTSEISSSVTSIRLIFGRID
ncbi:hypothetical protein JL720_10376 [Aureococcus anophagefferens]|nr:hypothetical protein JL720_10376 [Aureococcus anophagefferens]